MNFKIILPTLIVVAGFVCSYLGFSIPKDTNNSQLLSDIAPNLQILQFTGVFDIISSITHNTINALDYTLCFAMIFGLLIYFISKGSSFQLLAFCLSVMLIGIISNLISSICLPFTKQDVFDTEIMSHKVSSLQIISQIFWIGLLSYTLLAINKLRKFTFQENTKGSMKINESYFMNLEKSKRVTYNIFDVFLSAVLCGKIVLAIIGEWLNNLEHLLRPSIPVIILFVLSFFIYNIFFEYLFSSTPCMYLGKAKIISTNSKKVSFITILKRTFYKIIPLSNATDDLYTTENKIYVTVVKENIYSSAH